MSNRRVSEVFRIIAITLLILIGLSTSAEGVPIPHDTSATTQNVFNDKYLSWLRRVTLEAYTQTQEPDSHLLNFLGNALQVEAQVSKAPTLQLVLDQGAAILQSGNKSAYFLNWYGIMLTKSGRYTEAVPLLTEALAGFDSAEYLKIQAFFAAGYLASALKAADRNNRTQSEEIAFRHIDYMMLAVANGAFPDADIQIAYRLISERFIEPFKKQRWNHYFEKLKDLKEIDPWFKFMMMGRVEHRKAWNARGSGYAHTVTPEGWDGLATYGESAYTALRKAHDLHPEFPEAAAVLINIALTRQTPPDETPGYWFEKSISAQMDYEFAYKSYLWSLRPRWGGSQQAMKQQAAQCLATGRYDTIVPYVYFVIMREIAEDMPFNGWNCVFRDAAIADTIADMFKAYHKNDAWNTDWKQRFAVQEIFFNAWAGRYPDASRLLAALDHRLDVRDGFFEMTLSWDSASWVDLEGEIRAMTGPARKEIAEAEAKKCRLIQQLASASACPIPSGLLSDGTGFQELNELIEEYKKVLPLLKNDMDSTRWLAKNIAGIMMNYTFHGTYRPLQTAIRESSIETIRFMLENGIDPNECGDLNVAPLRYALDRNRMDVVLLLLEFGALPVFDANETMLHFAVRTQNVALSEHLVKQGVDVNAIDAFGRTPIYDAVIHNRLMFCRLLIENGASVNTISENNESLLQIAIQHRAFDVVRLLLQQDIDVNIVDNQGNSPIHFALASGEFDIMRDIINKNVNLNQVAHNKVPLLHVVATYGYADVIQLLLEKGADIDQKFRGKTALEYAVHFKQPKAAKVLKNWKRIKK